MHRFLFRRVKIRRTSPSDGETNEQLSGEPERRMSSTIITSCDLSILIIGNELTNARFWQRAEIAEPFIIEPIERMNERRTSSVFQLSFFSRLISKSEDRSM